MDITLITAVGSDLVHGTENDKKTGCGINLLKADNVTRYRRAGTMTDLKEITCEKCKSNLAKKIIKADKKEMARLLKEEKQREKMGVADEGKTWDSAAAFGSLPATATLHKGENLFPRIDTAKELAELDALEAANKAAAQAANAAAEEPKVEAAAASAELIGEHEDEISFDDFCKVELRVVEIRACERMKESKKLLHLTVFDGERERCILSGIAKWFKPIPRAAAPWRSSPTAPLPVRASIDACPRRGVKRGKIQA